MAIGRIRSLEAAPKKFFGDQCGRRRRHALAATCAAAAAAATAADGLGVAGAAEAPSDAAARGAAVAGRGPRRRLRLRTPAGPARRLSTQLELVTHLLTDPFLRPTVRFSSNARPVFHL